MRQLHLASRIFHGDVLRFRMGHARYSVVGLFMVILFLILFLILALVLALSMALAPVPVPVHVAVPDTAIYMPAIP